MDYKVNEIEDGRLRVIVTNNDNEVGILYFERAKTSFQNKPLSMNSWRCVDAKVFGLYEGEENEIPIPKDIIKQCQDLIRENGY
jgi:hypothetical protein